MRKTVCILLVLLLLFSFKTNERKRIIVIGDSISLAYGPYLKEMVSNKFDYSTKNTNSDAGNLDYPTGPNAGDSNMLLNYLKNTINDNCFHNDIFIINCGLHDIKVDINTGKNAIDIKQYALNLDSIFRLLKKTNKPVVWVNSTPVNDNIHNSKNIGFYRYNKDIILYNQIAEKICLKHNVAIIDLYSFSIGFPTTAYNDHVHYKPEYAKLQSAFIAGFIANIKL